MDGPRGRNNDLGVYFLGRLNVRPRIERQNIRDVFFVEEFFVKGLDLLVGNENNDKIHPTDAFEVKDFSCGFEVVDAIYSYRLLVICDGYCHLSFPDI